MNSQNIQSIDGAYLLKAKIVVRLYLGWSTVSDSEDAFLYGLDFCGKKGVG